MTVQKPMIDPEEVYRRYSGMVRARLSKFRFNSSELDDLLQEVFLRVVDSAHTFEGRSCVSTWLYQLTTRLAITHVHKHKRRQRLWIHTQDLHWAKPISESSQENLTLLRELLGQLEPEQSFIGLSYYRDGLSQSDIAERLGCSRQEISYHLNKLNADARTLVAD